VRGRLIERLVARWRNDDRYDARVVVLDTETSGLDPQRDQLLAIGAVGVDDAGIRVEDSFEVVVPPDEAVSRESVAIHGIGGEMQRAGVPPRDALAAFTSYVGGAPIVAFHAAFDRAVIERALSRAGVRADPLRWLDAAELAATLWPEEHKRGRRCSGHRRAVPEPACARGQAESPQPRIACALRARLPLALTAR